MEKEVSIKIFIFLLEIVLNPDDISIDTVSLFGVDTNLIKWKDVYILRILEKLILL